MFQVEFEVVVSSKAHRLPILLTRRIKLPFAPFPGLVLHGLMAERGEPIGIEAVAYDINEGTFTCELDDDQHIGDDDREIAMTIGEKLAEYGKEWQIREPGYDVLEDADVKG